MINAEETRARHNPNVRTREPKPERRLRLSTAKAKKSKSIQNRRTEQKQQPSIPRNENHTNTRTRPTRRARKPVELHSPAMDLTNEQPSNLAYTNTPVPAYQPKNEAESDSTSIPKTSRYWTSDDDIAPHLTNNNSCADITTALQSMHLDNKAPTRSTSDGDSDSTSSPKTSRYYTSDDGTATHPSDNHLYADITAALQSIHLDKGESN